MKSGLTYDLDEKNNPIILMSVGESTDVRDKIANRFLDAALKGEHNGFCAAKYVGVDQQNRTIIEIKSSENLYTYKEVSKILNQAKGNPLFKTLSVEDFLETILKK